MIFCKTFSSHFISDSIIIKTGQDFFELLTTYFITDCVKTDSRHIFLTQLFFLNDFREGYFHFIFHIHSFIYSQSKLRR